MFFGIRKMCGRLSHCRTGPYKEGGKIQVERRSCARSASSGHNRNKYTPESTVWRGVSRPESSRVLFGGLSRHLRRSLEKWIRLMRHGVPFSPTTLTNQFVGLIDTHCPPELPCSDIPEPRMAIPVDQQQVVPTDAYPNEGAH